MTDQEYNQCVELYADRIFSFILKNLKNRADAQDLVQITFMKTWTHRHEVNFQKAKSYLFTVAYRSMIDLIRKNDKMSYVEDFGIATPTDQNKASDLKDLLDQALKRLPEIQRTLILLRDYEGYSYKEIGVITDLGESQVKVYIFRARKALQKFIGNPEHVL